MKNMKRPRILITNDDGIHAPGIKHLWNSLKDLADLTIVAPATEQSSVGLSITLRQPLRIESIPGFGNTQAWSVSGTPADCIKLALSVILDHPPDMIASGINRGTNAGRNVLYSGTVGGAIEAAMRDLPGVAFSCHDYDDPYYSMAATHIPKILHHVIDNPLPKGSLLNVNFPSREHKQFKGFKLTRQGKEYWSECPDKREHPTEGHCYYWLGAKLVQFEEHEDCDISWLRRGYVTAVPVHVGELTDHQHLNSQKALFEKL